MDLSIWRLAVKEKTILLYFVYNFFFGLYPIVPIMSLFFLAKSLTFGQIGIVFAVFSVAGFLLEVPTGYLGDKYGKKASVMLGLVILTATSYIWTLLVNTISFAIFAAVWMLGLAFISGSLEAYIYEFLKRKKLVKIYDQLIATSHSILYFGGAIGSIAGAYLFSLNINFPYYLLSVLFGVCAVVVSLMQKDDTIKDSDYQEQLHVLSGLKHILKTPKILWITLFVSLLFGFFSYFRGSVDKPYILDLKLFDVQWLGVFVALSMIVQSVLMSQFAKLKNKLNENGLIILLWLMYALGLVGMSLFGGYLALFAVLVFYSTESMFEALINSFSQKYIPSSIRATTLSSIKVYQNIGGAVLGLIGGIVFDIFSIRTGLMIAFIYSCFVLLLTWFYKKRFVKV